MVLVFGSVYVVNYVYRPAYVEPALHPQHESYFICAVALSCFEYYIEDFCIDVHHGYWPEVFLLSYVSAMF